MNTIPELRLSRIQKLIEKFMASPKLILTKLFGSDKWDSEEIKWEGQVGNRGMTPFGSEDKESPITSPSGVSEHSAFAAFWHEKMRFGSNFLNNLRKPGTAQVKQKAKKYLATQIKMLKNRCDRRQEWMFAKMMTAGSFTYTDFKMKRVAVDYGVPSDHIVTLTGDDRWATVGDGVLTPQNTAKIVENIMDAQLTMSNANEGEIDYAIFTSEVMKCLVLNKGIQTLLQKSAFGNGDLFAKPEFVLGSLLNIKNMVKYDAKYQIRAWLTAALAAGAGPHTIYVDDTTDFEIGAKLYVFDASAKTKESVTITAVGHAAGTITATGTLASSYKALDDLVYMTKKYIPTTVFSMFSSTVEDQKIAEFAKAPFGLDEHYGMKVDRWEKKDPDGVYLRVENKGLPVLYFEDALYILTVAS